MKTLAMMIIALEIASLGFSAEETRPTLQQPIAELRLTNGKIFKNVTVIRYSKDAVTLKSSAGIGPLPYSYIPEPERGLMLAERDRPQAAAKPVASRELSGQVFITTRGAGSYKFSGATITAYPKSEYAAALDRVKYIARSGDDNSLQTAWVKEITGMKPVADSTTDADGKFTINLPGDSSSVFLYCFATRTISRYVADRLTSFTEIYLWAAPVTDGVKAFDLNGQNYVTSSQED